MKVTACDCCSSTKDVGRVVMDESGIHSPLPRPREDGFKPIGGADLCELKQQRAKVSA